MKMPLVIIGAGGFGREVAWQVSVQKEFCEKYDLIGFVDDDREIQGGMINGLPVVGNVDWLLKQKENMAVLIAVGSAAVREKISVRCHENDKLVFPTFIANEVQMSDTVVLGEGCIICAGNILTVNISLGNFALVNLSCTIGHDVVIKDYVTLYPGVHVSGNVTIGEVSELGTGSDIIQGKTIGDHVIIGAGAAVIRDIESCSTAVGVPAQIVRKREG